MLSKPNSDLSDDDEMNLEKVVPFENLKNKSTDMSAN